MCLMISSFLFILTKQATEYLAAAPAKSKIHTLLFINLQVHTHNFTKLTSYWHQNNCPVKTPYVVSTYQTRLTSFFYAFTFFN